MLKLILNILEKKISIILFILKKDISGTRKMSTVSCPKWFVLQTEYQRDLGLGNLASNQSPVKTKNNLATA